ncbi:MAG: response regulator transcription factor [Chloroflexota bacterium]|nr:response regulator transcription factor [Chloroflexota bacterium]
MTGRVATGAQILVVDDDVQILRALQTNLTAHGYRVRAVETGEQALEAFERQHPDVVILDLGLPGIDGLEVIRRVREHSQTPIVILSAREAEREKVQALDLGADDYLTKPFGAAELLARLRVALRHVAHPATGAAPVFRAGELEVDIEHRRVTVRGQEVHLRPTEYELLKALIAHPDKVLTHRWLLQHVWGPQYGDEGHYLHVYVAGLRKKLELDSQRPRYILTEPGVGYRFRGDPDAP